MTGPGKSGGRAIVVGGSMAGLFAAHLLRRIGWRVDVYERVDTELTGRGAGIVTHRALFDALEACGIPRDTNLGVEVPGRITFDRDGNPVGEVPLRQTLTSWDRLHHVLRSAFPDDRHHIAKNVERVAQHGDTVVAHFSDGATVEADLLVAADGFRSTVRSQLSPQTEPAYAGYVAWRGLVDEARISVETHRDLFAYFGFCLPPGEQMLGYPVAGQNNAMRPGERRYNFVWYRPADEATTLRELLTDESGQTHDMSIPPPLMHRRVVTEMRAASEALLCRQFAEIVALTEQPFIQPIYDLESSQMVFGRVVVIGDAAFVARPHVGMGVTKAAEDGVALTEALARSNGDVDAALRGFQQSRLKVGKAVIQRARHLGAYMQAQLKTPEEQALAEQHRTPEAVMVETATADFLHDVASPSAAGRQFYPIG